MAALTDVQLAAWRAFLEAHSAVVDVLAAELDAEHDLPLSWYDVLVHLSEAPDRQLRMQELAERILLSKSGLTRLVQRMESDGLVERMPCDDDRRGIWAVMTDAGYARLKEAAPVHLDGVRRHFADLLSDDEAAVLAAALDRIANADA